jgi:hypothetical protein
MPANFDNFYMASKIIFVFNLFDFEVNIIF